MRLDDDLESEYFCEGVHEAIWKRKWKSDQMIGQFQKVYNCGPGSNTLYIWKHVENGYCQSCELQ